MLKQAKLKYIACLVGVLSASIAFSGCSTAEAEAVPTNAVISESDSQIDTVNLDNLYTQTEAVYTAYEQNQVSDPDLAKACATAILLQEELTNNVNLQADTVYSEKINKAYDMLLKMDITKPDLQLQGDVAGTFPKLVDATETLVLLVGGETASEQSSSPSSGVSETLSSVAPPVSSPTSQTSSSPNLNSAKPASQAPKAESKPESKPASQAPTPKPAPKPESKPTSTAPTPAPVTPAKPAPEPAKPAPAPAPAPKPETGAIKTLYSGASYGAKDQSQFDVVMEKANGARSSSAVKKALTQMEALSDSDFQTVFGLPKTDTWVDILSIASRVGSGGSGQGSAGSAYDFFTGKSTMCGDRAKAQQAVLQANGYDAKLAWGTRNGVAHQWTMVKNPDDGQWYHLEGAGDGTSVPSGYKMTGSGYNYG
ncbi:transglutaminase domain-containing protein [Clostridium minihomine]|uniref:transglutaminase domain-containing protein n=1 Tax=Clostridium minihomine TaxID=2045012 RepID=UPI000C760F27|nr:transglutaminase domain-containing protein [Clostridium minihomine]